MKRQTPALSLLFIAITMVVVDVTLADGWIPIKNLENNHVVKIAEFAVKEHNRQAGSELRLYSIQKGELQVKEGTDYRLLLAVIGAGRLYEAVVHETYDYSTVLISFVPLKG
ncbi:PREDICTED: cysteine proteinase inhibitor 1-like [Populus euphratica]|uniref:Cysteine proteinase inhibitor 1-like n=1 Tax=Populus euphratica TaxID=75702 RepID=A0AAJ6TEE8_POPEU|nr:PREDICTED: cysteine proteinase inhibitor 1-like [Populus euphratica]